MKITYEVDTSDPDHEYDRECLENASAYRSALIGILEVIRNWNKYEHDQTLEKSQRVLDQVLNCVNDLKVY